MPGEHVYTVAAQTDTAGLLYLTVGVLRSAQGGLALAGYPAFVGAPAAGPAQTLERLSDVGEAVLSTVVERALRNYLAGSSTELAADLSSGARVSMPGLSLGLGVIAEPAVGAGRRRGARDRAGRGPARRAIHARLRTERRPRAGPLGDRSESNKPGRLDATAPKTGSRPRAQAQRHTYRRTHTFTHIRDRWRGMR